MGHAWQQSLEEARVSAIKVGIMMQAYWDTFLLFI